MQLWGCHNVCHVDGCKGTSTNPIPNGVQWYTRTPTVSENGCCLIDGACDLCCPSGNSLKLFHRFCQTDWTNLDNLYLLISWMNILDGKKKRDVSKEMSIEYLQQHKRRKRSVCAYQICSNK